MTVSLDESQLRDLPPIERIRAAQNGIDEAKTITGRLAAIIRDAAREEVASRPRERDRIAAELGISVQRLSQLIAPTAGERQDQRLDLLRAGLRLAVAYSTADIGELTAATQAIDALHGQRRLDPTRLHGVCIRLIAAARHVDTNAMSDADTATIREAVDWAARLTA